MENKLNSNENTDKGEKITLKSYYKNLPDAVHPKTEFITNVVKETGASSNTVRNWIIYGMKPSNEEHTKVLSRLTGIKIEDLWD